MRTFIGLAVLAIAAAVMNLPQDGAAQNCPNGVCPAPRIVDLPKRATKAAPVVQSCPGGACPTGPRWVYRGSDLAGHVRDVHGIDPSGMSQAELEAAHSAAHNATGSVRSVRTSRPRLFSGGLFRRLRGGCCR